MMFVWDPMTNTSWLVSGSSVPAVNDVMCWPKLSSIMSDSVEEILTLDTPPLKPVSEEVR